jgi:hypothetical protein
MGFKKLLAIVAVLTATVCPAVASGIEEEDIATGESNQVVTFLEDLSGTIQTGVVKTTAIKGFTWEEKVQGALAVAVFVGAGFLVHRKRGAGGRTFGRSVLAPGLLAEEANPRPFTLRQSPSEGPGEDTAGPFRA